MSFTFIKKLINKMKCKQISQCKLINVRDILILPNDDKTIITTHLKQVTYKIFERYNILEFLHGFEKYIIKLTDQVHIGKPINQTYSIWKEDFFPQVETPFNLPRKPNNPICPPNIILARLECINSYTSNMGSFWGFNGYVLMMLIDQSKLEVWDARGEKAY